MGAAGEEQWFYVGARGAQAGPVAPAAMKQLYAAGSVTFETLVWQEGRHEWVEIWDEPTLKALLKPRTSQTKVKLAAPKKASKRPKPPLPKAAGGWMEKCTVDGVAYYHHAAKDAVTYDKPDVLKTAAEKAAGLASSDMVWIRDATKAWVAAKVVDGKDASSLRVEHPNGTVKEVARSAKEPLWPLSSLSSLEHLADDLVMIDELNEAMMVHNLVERYMEDAIYTWVGASHTVLVAINPFQRLPIYGVSLMRDFAQPAPYKLLPPHPFAIANNAYVSMSVEGANQAILISGESGAGKTEATKQCLAYLAEIAGSTTNVEQKILSANPVLEAFGNAKTLRNNNSSRFGRWMEIHFDVHGAIASARMENYLLEKIRVVAAAKGERSYHIFYGLLDSKRFRGLSDAPQHHAHLAASKTYRADGIDDRADFAEVEQALNQLGFDGEEQKVLLSLAAGVLRLGDVEFAKHKDGCKVANPAVAADAASLLGIPREGDLAEALTHKALEVGRDRTMTPLDPAEARTTTDAFAKAIYGNLFNWLVRRINEAVAEGSGEGPPASGKFIGVLDIFGFEIFEKNSFEQLCINYTNEKLQQHFNSHTFKEEEELYRAEGVAFDPVAFIDNQPILELIEKKPAGLLPSLDDVVHVPNPSDEKWLSLCDKAHGASKPLWHCNVKGDVGDFTLRHYAGDVTYSAASFCEKNKDPLGRAKYDCMALKATAFPLTARALFPPLGTQPRKTPTITGQFRKQLSDLMTIVNAAEPLYIRCVKPNSAKKARKLETAMTIEQLTFAGVFEAVKIRKEGYPFRLTHKRFLARYRPLVDAHKVIKRGALFKGACEALIAALRQPELAGSMQLGTTKVLYRAPEHRVLELRRNLALERLMPTAQRAVRRGMGRRYLAKLARIRRDLGPFEQHDDSAAIDAALAAAREALGPHQSVFPFWPVEFDTCKARRFLLQERLDLDVVFRKLDNDAASYDALADAVRRAERIKAIPGTAQQLALEGAIRQRLTAQAGAKLDPVAAEALGLLFKPYMESVVIEARNASYVSADLTEIETLLALPETEFTAKQLKLANAHNDPDRVVNREVRLKQLMLETYAALYAVDKYAHLRDADDWAAAKSFFLGASKRKKVLVASFLKHTEVPIHLGLTDLAKKPGLDRQAQIMFKNILGFCGDRKLPAPEAAASEALNIALTGGDDLRAELYLQLMKQLTANPNDASRAQAWDLLAAALASFPPPATLENVLGLFVKRNAAANKKDYLVAALYAAVYGGARKSPLLPDDVPFLAAQVYKTPISPRYQVYDIIQTDAGGGGGGCGGAIHPPAPPQRPSIKRRPSAASPAK